MEIILIPGLWLDGSSWEKVVPTLEQAGHRAHSVTLPGMEARNTDRSSIILQDHVDAVTAAIDAVDGKVILVGHSAGAAIAYAAVDARPNRVARAIYVGGFPTGDGDVVADGFPTENGEVALPDWSDFAEEDLVDLDDIARAEFRKRAIPAPERVTRDPQKLSDESRYDVPATVICTEFTSEMLRNWIGQEAQPVREFTKIRDVTYIDVPTGHWPQFTRPEALGRAILAAIAARPAGSSPTLYLDDYGRPEPPDAADEIATLIGFLEYQRATLMWKCAGLDESGLKATVGASTMTLGGMLKHLAFVEEYWFALWLHGRPPQSPWDTVDWENDPDWAWHSAADSSPEELIAFWQRAVADSRSLVEEALADGGLERLARLSSPEGRTPSLRWILFHMLEEYARHNGHADLIRESVDGETGE